MDIGGILLTLQCRNCIPVNNIEVWAWDMRESAKSARHNSLKLTIQRRGLRAPGGSQDKQLSQNDSCFFLLYNCNFAHTVKPRVKPKTKMSETVNVVYYKSKSLWDGSHPLMVRVCKDGKKKYQSIGISILPSHWDCLYRYLECSFIPRAWWRIAGNVCWITSSHYQYP